MSEQTEQAAMCLDRLAVLKVVSALRLYRAAAQALLGKRQPDWGCDGPAVHCFSKDVQEIEDLCDGG